VLDDAASAAQVRPLIPTGPGSAVLVTSRRVLGALDAATHLHLRPMSEPDSCDLLAAMVSTNQAEASPGSVRALRNVVELCGRLPLAVRIAAARLAAHPEWDLDTLGGRLSDARQRLNELRYADLDIRASFAMSTAGLEPGPLRLFEQLGLLDLDHISVPLAATIEGKPQHTDPSRLDALIEAQLLSTAGQDRYAFHDLIRIYARELAGADLDRAQQDETIQRAHHHYLATIRNAAAILTPATEPRLSMGIPPAQIHVEGLSFESRTEAAQWVDTEAANLLATARQAAGTSAGQPVVVALSAAAAGPFYTRRHIRTLTHLAQLAIEAADACGNEPGLAQAHSDLALGYLAVDRIEDALEHTELALRAWTQAGDLSYQAGTLNNIGILWQRLGDTDLALDYFRRSRDIRGQLGHTQAQAAVLANMADAFAERTEYPAAVAHLEEARTLYRLAGHPGGEGYALGSLGIVYLKAGEPARARTCLERALQLVDRAALRHFAEFCWYLGAAHHALGDSEQAQDFRRQALDCLQETGVLSAVEAQAILADPSPATPQPFR
jgi:tetratricopeptide (TPR) repeat protein